MEHLPRDAVVTTSTDSLRGKHTSFLHSSLSPLASQ